MDHPSIPFCRKSHAQVTGAGGVIFFGGLGIDYIESASGGFLADVWRLLLRDSPSHSSEEFEWMQLAPLPGRPWPSPRKSFGYGATQRENWLLVHGGESKTDTYSTSIVNSILGDLWVFRGDGWVKLLNSVVSTSYPAARKNHVMAVLPKSGSLVIMGGQGLQLVSGKRSSSSSNGLNPLLSCMSDVWTLNVNALIDSMMPAHSSMIPGNTTGNGGFIPPSSSSLESKSRANETASWRQVSSIPLQNQRFRCFEGFSSTGVLDPADGSKEKVFVFGGRYSDYSVSPMRRRLEAANARFTGGGGGGGGGGVGGGGNSTNVPEYSYSNAAFLYDPAADLWTKLVLPPGSFAPVGRDKHATVYVRELDTVFVTGGRSWTNLPRAVKQQVNASGLVTRATGSYTIMDVWGFNLSSREWTEYASALPSPSPSPSPSPVQHLEPQQAPLRRRLSNEDGSEAEGIQRQRQRGLSDLPTVPAARYEHTVSIWRGADGLGHPQLVLFGGQHELRRSSMRRRLGDPEAQRPAKGGGWSVASDDDSSFGVVGVHSQLNDIWVLDLQAGPATNWKLVSIGGCSAGASGKINDKPGMDWVAVAFVSAVMAAFLFGVAAHRTVIALQKWYRGNYDKIDEESVHGGASGAESAGDGISLGPVRAAHDAPGGFRSTPSPEKQLGTL